MKKLVSSLAIVLPLLLASAAWAGSPPAQIHAGLLARLGQQTPLPSGWHGIWDFQFQLKDCETQQVLFSFSQRDTICPNEDVVQGDDFEYECTGTVTETTFQLVCNASYEEPAGCAVVSHIEIQGTRDGDAFSSTGTFSSTFTGDTCVEPGTFCSIIVQTGTRVSTSTAGCETAVEDASWGQIKSVYR